MTEERNICLRWLSPDGSTTYRWEAAIPEGVSEHERQRILNLAIFQAKYQNMPGISLLEELGKKATIR